MTRREAGANGARVSMHSERREGRREYQFTVVVERDEDGAYIAICPALRGCHTAGDTEAEALDLIEDAIRLHVEARPAFGDTTCPQRR
jgi:predicted RNase H-like HicB family nuclease